MQEILAFLWLSDVSGVVIALLYQEILGLPRSIVLRLFSVSASDAPL